MGSLKEERDLIRGFMAGDLASTERFYIKYETMFRKIAEKYKKNRADVQDLKDEIFSAMFLKFKKKRPPGNIKNLDFWLYRVADRICKELERKLRGDRVKRLKAGDVFILELGESDAMVADGSTSLEDSFINEEYSREFESRSLVEKLSSEKPDLINKIERSLDYVEIIYWIKNKDTAMYSQVLPLIKSGIILRSSEQKISDLLNSYNIEKIDHDLESIPSVIEKDVKQLFHAFVLNRHKQLLGELRDHFDKMRLEISTGYYLLCGFGPEQFLNEDFIDIVEHIPKLKIDPIKLIYRIWIKDPDLKKGKYNNRKLIEELLLHFKSEYSGTSRGDLFKLVNADFNLDTTRKKIYKKSKNSSLYDLLADFVYRKSFIEEESPVEAVYP